MQDASSLPDKPQGMLSAAYRSETEMPEDPGYDDLILVPAGEMALRRMSAAGPETSPA